MYYALLSLWILVGFGVYQPLRGGWQVTPQESLKGFGVTLNMCSNDVQLNYRSNSSSYFIDAYIMNISHIAINSMLFESKLSRQQ